MGMAISGLQVPSQPLEKVARAGKDQNLKICGIAGRSPLFAAKLWSRCNALIDQIIPKWDNLLVENR